MFKQRNSRQRCQINDTINMQLGVLHQHSHITRYGRFQSHSTQYASNPRTAAKNAAPAPLVPPDAVCSTDPLLGVLPGRAACGSGVCDEAQPVLTEREGEAPTDGARSQSVRLRAGRAGLGSSHVSALQAWQRRGERGS